MPAHFCGVTGLKTTVGRISRAGAMPLSQSLDTVGPLARTVEDCALLLGLMAGADPADPTAITGPLPDYNRRDASQIKGLTIGVPTAFYVDDLDPRSRASSMRRLPCSSVRAQKSFRSNCRTSASSPRPVNSFSRSRRAAFHKRWMIERPGDYGAQVLMRLQNGLAIPGVSYLEVMRWRGPALAAHLAASPASMP